MRTKVSDFENWDHCLNWHLKNNDFDIKLDGTSFTSWGKLQMTSMDGLQIRAFNDKVRIANVNAFGCSGIVLRDLLIQDTYGIRIEDCYDIELQNLVLIDIDTEHANAIRVIDVEDFKMVDCTLTRTRLPEKGIDRAGVLLRGNSASVINRCNISNYADSIQTAEDYASTAIIMNNNLFSAPRFKGHTENGIDIKGGKVIFNNNTVYGFKEVSGRSSGFGVMIQLNAKNCELQNNLIFDCNGGIFIAGSTEFTIVTDNSIANIKIGKHKHTGTGIRNYSHDTVYITGNSFMNVPTPVYSVDILKIGSVFKIN